MEDHAAEEISTETRDTNNPNGNEPISSFWPSLRAQVGGDGKQDTFKPWSLGGLVRQGGRLSAASPSDYGGDASSNTAESKGG